MRKISWFKRLFMSWETLEMYFKKTEVESPLAKELESVKLSNASLEAEVKASRERIVELKTFFEEKNTELQVKASEIANLKQELQNVSAVKDSLVNEKLSSENKLSDKIHELDALKEKLQLAKNDFEMLKTDISKKLDPLSKIERTFFAQSGNKGKGMLGELQLETLLQKSGMTSEAWVKNLSVGSTIVEFAIKADMTDKWIPVDSKVLDADLDEEGKLIISDSYKSKVLTQAKEVAKYLSKANTTDYGLLVLQSDEIYMELFDKYPDLFDKVIKEHKIYICSPSSFIQFAWSLTNILEIYSKVHKDEKLYDEVIGVLETVNKLSLSLSKVHKDFNTAMDRHYPALQNKQNKLVKKLKKEEKIKELPNLNGNSSTDLVEEEE